MKSFSTHETERLARLVGILWLTSALANPHPQRLDPTRFVLCASPLACRVLHHVLELHRGLWRAWHARWRGILLEWHMHRVRVLPAANLLELHGYMPGGHDEARSTRHARVQQWHMHGVRMLLDHVLELDLHFQTQKVLLLSEVWMSRARWTRPQIRIPCRTPSRRRTWVRDPPPPTLRTNSCTPIPGVQQLYARD